MSRVLYISYDGLTDPLGQSQVLPYLIGCARAGHSITVISFEKAAAEARLGEAVRAQCAAERLDWPPERFRTSPPYLSKWLDQRRMAAAAMAAAQGGSFDIVHCRSYPPALAGLDAAKATGARMIFDMRGFWPDSRREGGRWRSGSPLGSLLFRRWKMHEARLVGEADVIVSLTDAAAAAIRGWPSYRGQPIAVIPCCADFDIYRPSGDSDRRAAREELGLAPDAPLLGYVGSLGTIYRLGEQARLFDAVRRRDPAARMLFIGDHRPDDIVAGAAAAGVSLTREQFRIVRADRADIARWISAVDVGLCFYTPTFSSLGVSPTKLAEYFACGVPAIANRGVGDVETIIGSLDGGHVMPDFSDASVAHAADAFFALRGCDPFSLRDRARPSLDLPRAVAAYDAIYRDLTP